MMLLQLSGARPEDRARLWAALASSVTAAFPSGGSVCRFLVRLFDMMEQAIDTPSRTPLKTELLWFMAVLVVAIAIAAGGALWFLWGLVAAGGGC